MVKLLRFFIKTNVFFLLIFFVFGAPALAQESRYGGTLIYGSMGQPLNLDPGVINDSESELDASCIFETLVRYDGVKGTYIPKLAERWESTPDKKIWTFYLRKNVTFHDGTPFNAEAVKFNWERQMLQNHPFHNPDYGRFTFYRSIWGGIPGNIQEIKVLNKNTIRVILYTRSHNFLRIISRIPFAIASPTAIIKKGGKFSSQPVGTGPFKFVEWRDWQRILLVCNHDYWGGRPYLDRLIFEPTPGEYSRRRQVEREHIDVTESPGDELVEAIYSGKVTNLKVQGMPSENFSFISLNCQKPPLDVPMVRRALCFAIDKNKILGWTQEKILSADSPVDKMLGVSISGRSYPYNPGTAKALLKKAGYPNGFPIELWYIKIARPFAINPENIAYIVEKNFRDIGLDVTVKGMKWETYQEKLSYGEHQAAITGYVGIYDNPEIYFQVSWDRSNAVLGGTNISFFKNDQINALLAKLRYADDQRTMLDTYRSIQKILGDECPIIPLFHKKGILVMNKRVFGLNPARDGTIDFSKTWIRK